MTDPVRDHKRGARANVPFGVITLSNSRGPAEDASGNVICDLLEAAGHRIARRRWIRDDPAALSSTLDEMLAHLDVAAVVTTGGTGLSSTDVTVETMQPLFEKELSGFQALFAHLSYEQVQSAAILSRSTAGVIRGKPVFCLPGSTAACRLAVEKLILPEIGHILTVLKYRGP